MVQLQMILTNYQVLYLLTMEKITSEQYNKNSLQIFGNDSYLLEMVNFTYDISYRVMIGLWHILSFF